MIRRLYPLAFLTALLVPHTALAQSEVRSVRLEIQGQRGPGAWWTKRIVEVDEAGQVWVIRSHPDRFYNGPARPQELSALRAAVPADLPGIPTPLPVAHPVSVPRRPFSLDVRYTGSSKAVRIQGQHGVYGAWASRLAPVIDQLERIGRRIEDRPGPGEALGRVVVDGDRVRVVETGRTVDLEGSLAKMLVPFAGHRVRVRGELSGSRLRVTEILNPQRWRVLYGVVRLRSQGPALRLRSIPEATGPVPAFGPARRVLRLARDREVHVDAWLFEDPAGRIDAACVMGVRARVTRTSRLSTAGGWWRGVARARQDVWVRGLSSDGDQALIDAGWTGRGFIETQRLRLGTGFDVLPRLVGLTTGLGRTFGP